MWNEFEMLSLSPFIVFIIVVVWILKCPFLHFWLKMTIILFEFSYVQSFVYRFHSSWCVIIICDVMHQNHENVFMIFIWTETEFVLTFCWKTNNYAFVPRVVSRCHCIECVKNDTKKKVIINKYAIIHQTMNFVVCISMEKFCCCNTFTLVSQIVFGFDFYFAHDNKNQQNAHIDESSKLHRHNRWQIPD